MQLYRTSNLDTVSTQQPFAPVHDRNSIVTSQQLLETFALRKFPAIHNLKRLQKGTKSRDEDAQPNW